ncbi:MAG: AAA family ATPase, partial [Gammaproteobacteria bacterium]
LGSAHQTTQVERARIEQLENQLRRFVAQADRLAVERETIAAQSADAQLEALTERESLARLKSEELADTLSQALEVVQTLRSEQLAVEARLESVRGARERTRSELMSLEALQKAALSHEAGRATEWLAGRGLGGNTRVAQTLEVEQGWERAVETALGDYLEAVCVDRLDDVATALDGFNSGRVAVIEAGESAGVAQPGSLAAKVKGPAAVINPLGDVITADTLAEALAGRGSLPPGKSIMTRRGEWLGRNWLRVSRGEDHHAGVIEREHRLKSLRSDFSVAEERVRTMEESLGEVRQSLADAEAQRDGAQSGIQGAHREHADLLGQLEAMRARSQESTLRRARLDAEASEVAREVGVAQEAMARARGELDRGLLTLGELDSRKPELEDEREERRETVAARRADAQAAQMAARDLLIRSESRRSTESSVTVSLARMVEQRAQLAQRCADLEKELASGDAPILELQSRLDDALARRLEVEAELSTARRALEDADAELRELDGQRVEAEQRVQVAREAMEAARLAAQETRVRRESIAEQFAATNFVLEEVQLGLPGDSSVPVWEDSLGSVRADIEKLGQVNLAAIDELKEQTERKDYLDRQFKDLTDALDTLEQAMKRIDKETRTRFEETFNKINTGLQEKFPRLFGGGHAYLELVGEDPLAAGISIMARPPGKRNSTIHQLSGGEKALTAVALVFSIFDLNPAPFCLLDEVDAPLDEHNVSRFCDIVKEMSQRVQFIFITHNKTTMELASQLIGVTMNEPGVSRLVAVDVDEAIRLAAV